MMNGKMPCSISDGPQELGDELFTPPEENDDDAYERIRQQEIDDRFERSVTDDLLESLGGICTDPFELLDIREEQRHD